jgi:hypothetical protein
VPPDHRLQPFRLNILNVSVAPRRWFGDLTPKLTHYGKISGGNRWAERTVAYPRSDAKIRIGRGWILATRSEFCRRKITRPGGSAAR